MSGAGHYMSHLRLRWGRRRWRAPPPWTRRGRAGRWRGWRGRGWRGRPRRPPGGRRRGRGSPSGRGRGAERAGSGPARRRRSPDWAGRGSGHPPLCRRVDSQQSIYAVWKVRLVKSQKTESQVERKMKLGKLAVDYSWYISTNKFLDF